MNESCEHRVYLFCEQWWPGDIRFRIALKNLIDACVTSEREEGEREVFPRPLGEA